MFELNGKHLGKRIGNAWYNFAKKPVSPIIKATMINPRKKSNDNNRSRSGYADVVEFIFKDGVGP